MSGYGHGLLSFCERGSGGRSCFGFVATLSVVDGVPVCAEHAALEARALACEPAVSR